MLVLVLGLDCVYGDAVSWKDSYPAIRDVVKGSLQFCRFLVNTVDSHAVCGFERPLKGVHFELELGLLLRGTLLRQVYNRLFLTADYGGVWNLFLFELLAAQMRH